MFFLVVLGWFAGSILFSLIPNTAGGALSPWYEKSLAGLLTCYIVALPFFASTLFGDQFFTFLLFRYKRFVHYLIPVSHETVTSA